MDSHEAVKILITDDHELLRKGLAAGFEMFEDFQVVAEARNGAEAVDICKELSPDVVIMDLVMPVMDGVTATRVIRERYPDVRVIALTSFNSPEVLQAAIEAGASTYIFKNVSIDEIAETIRDVVGK